MASISKPTLNDVSTIKARIHRGEFQHRFAADNDLNQGRISEIAQGKNFAHFRPAALLDQRGGTYHVC